jgi:hypothetical protein
VPPAEVLVRIATLTNASLRWLLTGQEAPATQPIDHPILRRAAELLRNPANEASLSAFMDLLAQTNAFPAKHAATAAATSAEETSSDTLVSAELAESASPLVPPGHAEALQRQGWIPILGRSAAGVPHFWRDSEQDEVGIVRLRDLVGIFRPRSARHVHPAEAYGDLSGEESAAQLVLLDSPESPGTAEFVVAEHIARKYDPVFAVRIDGRSMEPDICHGDVVVLSPHCPAEQGKPAVVQLSDQIGVTCKLYREDEQGVHLIPVNEQFSPQLFSREQVVWALKVLARIRPI